MLAALADTVIAYIDTRRQRSENLPATSGRPARKRYTDAPQILVPNPQTVEHLKTLGADLRLRRVDDETPGSRSVQRLGHWLTYLTDRAHDIPGSAALIPMTGFLGMHWITGQSPLEDNDLATLLAWIDPPRHADSGRDAADKAADPATHRPAGPATDAAFDNDQLAPLFHAYARARGQDQTRIMEELNRLLTAYMRPTWELMWHAYTLLQALPEAKNTTRRWDLERTAFTEECTYLDQDGRPQPAREQAAATAARLARMEHAAITFAAERAADDPFVRAELRTTGEAFAGHVTTLEPEHTLRGPTGRGLWRPRFSLATSDPVVLDPGRALACHTHPGARYKIRTITHPDGDTPAETNGETLVEVEITAGMGTVTRPNHAVLPEPGAVLVFTLAPDHYRMPEFPTRDQTPWTHGGPPAGHPHGRDVERSEDKP
ncbi:hypothetical protein ACFY8W_36525 [Streptomyces sp. NPDC012637]|uniref:hypothetical protein n=1 Tax=Streptomyces sp. NPDC012637 TaxID=3364842 RepID=UPI0036E7A7B6